MSRLSRSKATEHYDCDACDMILNWRKILARNQLVDKQLRRFEVFLEKDKSQTAIAPSIIITVDKITTSVVILTLTMILTSVLKLAPTIITTLTPEEWWFYMSRV